jgi:CDP-paratose synthetase
MQEGIYSHSLKEQTRDSDMNIAIAGATGYLGAKLVERLLAPDTQQICENNLLLIVRDKSSVPKTITKQGNVLICNINEDLLHDSVVNFCPDIIFCTTCCYETDPDYLYKTVDSNYVFPAKLLQIVAALKKKAKFFFIGTSLPPSLNLYALTKNQFADLGFFFHQVGKIEFVNILLENFYGINEPKNRFITRSILKLKANQDLLLTEGTQRRDFIFIEDVVEILMFLVDHKKTAILAESGYAIPIGTGVAPSIKEIMMFLHEETHSKSVLKFGALKMRENEPSTKADLSILRKLGFKKPLTHWQDGMKKVIESI